MERYSEYDGAEGEEDLAADEQIRELEKGVYEAMEEQKRREERGRAATNRILDEAMKKHERKEGGGRAAINRILDEAGN